MLKGIRFYVLAVFCVLGLAGCQKSDSAAGGPVPPAGASESVVLKLHWLGKKQLATDTSFRKLMQVWALSESGKLENQTLDKLSTSPWRLWYTNWPLATAPTVQLRQLLSDLVQEESYLEIRAVSNAFPKLALAIRLDTTQAAYWRSNLPTVLSACGPSTNAPAPFRISWAQTAGWTLAEISNGGSESETPAALAMLQERIKTYGTPSSHTGTNYLLDFEGQVPALAAAVGMDAAAVAGARSLRFGLFGDGDTIKTRGSLEFDHPLQMPLEPWDVPTNFIGQPLVSFSAVRGCLKPLEGIKFWEGRKLGAAPSQIFFWSQNSAPWLHFFATRTPQAEAKFGVLKDFILDWVNPELAPNRTGDFAWMTNEAKVVWKGVPFCSPAFQLRNDLILGGFVADPLTNRSMPVEFLHQLNSNTNLVYYDWENSGPQVASWVQIGQLMRMAFSRAQLSITNAGLPWLQVLHTNLDFSATSVDVDGERLSFARSSTVGLTSLELQFFADWLDSPQFPLGLYTFTSPREFVADRARLRKKQ